IMSNVLLVVALELALVGDYFTQKVRMFFLWLFGTLNLLAIAYLFSILVFPIPNIYIPLGSSKGFSLGEIVLILNAIVSVVILAVNFGKLRKKEKVVFLVVVGMFLLGLVFATGSDGYIFPKHIAWHSMWHIVGSFGFVLFWYFNHLRFSNKE
ncbi:MAG: hypothetical protein N3G21_08955, partial [Candidatus Hydrogenedentes bacterium]|nr:hypothetical protein [Candidatus Hydrogenedentota bacterium]